MKIKGLVLALVGLFLITGCTCEYNLTIDDNEYKEEIKIIAENENESSQFNTVWKIPTDKDEYNIPGDPGSTITYKSDLYNYKVISNTLYFNYDFTKNEYLNSSAISNCYDRLTMVNHEHTLVISTSLKANCFEKYPDLKNVTINITVDREVISANADKKNGKTYTWYINKNNYKNKSININLANKTENRLNSIAMPSSSSSAKTPVTNNNDKKEEYITYIALLIILIIMIVTYLYFHRMMKKNNQMDD